jgi:hypothetical protein
MCHPAERRGRRTGNDEFGKRLYAVNARFTTLATPDTPYRLAQFRKIRGH